MRTILYLLTLTAASLMTGCGSTVSGIDLTPYHPPDRAAVKVTGQRGYLVGDFPSYRFAPDRNGTYVLLHADQYYAARDRCRQRGLDLQECAAINAANVRKAEVRNDAH